MYPAIRRSDLNYNARGPLYNYRSNYPSNSNSVSRESLAFRKARSAVKPSIYPLVRRGQPMPTPTPHQTLMRTAPVKDPRKTNPYAMSYAKNPNYTNSKLYTQNPYAKFPEHWMWRTNNRMPVRSHEDFTYDPYSQTFEFKEHARKANTSTGVYPSFAQH